MIIIAGFSVPGTPPVDIVFQVRSPHNVTVQWSPPNAPNGIITRYTIYVDYENGTQNVFSVDGQSTSYNITGLLPYQIISVDIAASTVVGKGPHSLQKEVQSAQAGKSWASIE